MPTTKPLLLAWNCTPRLFGLVSFASTAPVGVPFCQMLHGHCPTVPVLNVQENGLVIGVPEAFCAPDTVAVKVATVSAPLKPTVPDTGFPLEFTTVNDTVPGTTG